MDGIPFLGTPLLNRTEKIENMAKAEVLERFGIVWKYLSTVANQERIKNNIVGMMKTGKLFPPSVSSYVDQTWHHDA